MAIVGARGRRLAAVTLQSALVGVCYSAATQGRVWAGAAVGASLGASFSFLEAFVFDLWGRKGLSRLPFSVYFGLRLAIYFTLVIAANLAAVGLTGRGMGSDVGVSNDIAFALVVCVLLNLLFSVNELLGPGVLFAFAAGRYRRPRREERVLLYIDLCGSTGLAERLGEQRFLDLLNRFYEDVTEEILAEDGEIHKYVGDEVIATWGPNTDPLRPIRATFAAQRRLQQRASAYRAEFGEAAQFRAAIHAGPVVIGELGAQKKEIALIGDGMNTAARILEAARENGAAVLVSAPYFDQLRAPDGFRARRLTPLALRGKQTPLALVSLEGDGRALPATTVPI